MPVYKETHHSAVSKTSPMKIPLLLAGPISFGTFPPKRDGG